jgi:sulfate/thiosulfate transport system ATP-binding protein
VPVTTVLVTHDQEEAMVERVVHLGFEVRAELVLDDGRRVSAQVTRDEADELDLHDGQTVFVRPSRTHVFSAAAAPPGHS